MRSKVLGAIVTGGFLLGLLPTVVLGATVSVGQNSVNLNVGQSTNINISSSNGEALNVFYNSNTFAVSASVSNNTTLILSGLNAGSAEVRVCNSESNCASVFATVGSGGGTGSGTVWTSPSSLNMYVGEVRNVPISSTSSGAFYVVSNSNSFVVTPWVSGSNLELRALATGSSTVRIGQLGGSVTDVYVTVGGSTGSNITFSQSNVTLNQNQSASVNVFGGNGSYYLQSNSNSAVVNAWISGSTLNLYGNTMGSATITVNGSNSGSGVLYVTVGSSSDGLRFNSTFLPQPYVGSSYSQQLQVVGGSFPFSFSLYSGSLPDGLFLTSSGQVYGTPQNNLERSFTIRVADNSSRTALGNFYLKPTGSVAGTNIYANGTLINDGGTIYTTYKNTKSGFASMAAFNGLGYKLSNVISANSQSLNNNFFVVTNSNIAHPWGTWIKNGNTVYFVHDTGLIPISRYDIFTSNGGRDAMLVTANSYDMTKPILAIMDYSDYRLH